MLHHLASWPCGTLQRLVPHMFLLVDRVRLPVNLETDTGVILGEGKPENQNHAAIFCHMETLQTIDCNQV